MANNRIKTDAGKQAEALRRKVFGRRGLCGSVKSQDISYRWKHHYLLIRAINLNPTFR
jgi:hypothetical protein